MNQVAITFKIMRVGGGVESKDILQCGLYNMLVNKILQLSKGPHVTAYTHVRVKAYGY